MSDESKPISNDSEELNDEDEISIDILKLECPHRLN